MGPGALKRWIARQWNLRRREFLLWRQKLYVRCVEFYIIERTIWDSRKRRPREDAKIAKPSRQLYRAITRRYNKLNKRGGGK